MAKKWKMEVVSVIGGYIVHNEVNGQTGPAVVMTTREQILKFAHDEIKAHVKTAACNADEKLQKGEWDPSLI